MNKLLWVVSAAAIAICTPAAAEAQGKGKGAEHSGHGAKAKGNGNGQMRRDGKVQTKARARTDARANTRARTRTGASVDRQADMNGNGIADYRERFSDRDRDGLDDRTGKRYGSNACPPGLAKKSPACIPPGQAKRMFSQGQRVPSGYGYYTDYDNIPLQYRDDIPSRYGSDAYRYIHRDDSIYVVDRKTSIVSEIINLLR
jgi:hypothetical protein